MNLYCSTLECNDSAMETCHPIVPAEPRLQGIDNAADAVLLPSGATRAIDPGDVRALRCLDGLIWVTQERNATDVILSAGDRFLPARRGKIVVQALSDSAVRVK
jgi:hypothetical protein